jgi:PIN domain nuclease of toxin-antitoxin system
VRLLLDSHVLLWWVTNDATLGERARAEISTAETVTVSAATVLELGIKRAAGRLRAPDDLDIQIGRHGFTPLDITIAHADAAARLPRLHGDPFDRMLIAQAQLEGLTVVTREPQIARYQVPTLTA